MANLIQKGSGKEEEKAIKVELPDGTAGEIPIKDAALRTEIFDANNVPQYTPGYKEGGPVKSKKTWLGIPVVKEVIKTVAPAASTIYKGVKVVTKKYKDKVKKQKRIEEEKKRAKEVI